MTVTLTVQEFIKKGQTQKALDFLFASTEDSDLQQQLSILGSRYERWKKASLVLDDNNDIELNKINQALLSIGSHEAFMGDNSNQKQEGFLGKIDKKTLYTIGLLAIIIVLAAFLYPKLFSNQLDELSITAYIHGPQGPSDLQEYGEVRLRLGSFLINGKSVNEKGEVVFEGIPIKYQNDTISLQFIEHGYDVISQTSYVYSKNNRITFEVKPSLMKFRGKVLYENKAIQGAIVDIDYGEGVDTTDANGYFEMMLPFPEGSKKSVSIEYQGSVQFNSSSETLSSKQPVTWTLNSE